MSKQKLIIASLVFIVLCLTPLLVYGQEEPQQGKRDSPQSIPSLLIINGSASTKVNFSLKNGDGNWVDFSLNPRKDRTFRNTTNIRIATEDDNTVEYRLEYGERYRIYWNQAKECWDVTRLVPK